MRAWLAAPAVLAFAASGCGGDSEALDPAAEGRHFGCVGSVDPASTPASIEFDVAELLIGDEATAAAVEDGAIAEGEAVPNDYYIRHRDEIPAELAVASDVLVTHVQCRDGCTDGILGDFDAFAASFADTGEKSLADEYRGAQSRYWVRVRDGMVVAIDEQYLP